MVADVAARRGAGSTAVFMGLQLAQAEADMLASCDLLRALGRLEPNIALEAAGWYMARGQMEKAERALRDTLDVYPTDQLLLVGLAKIEYQLKKRDQAISRLRQVLDRNPANLVVGGILYRHYLRRLNFVEAYRIWIRSAKALHDIKEGKSR